MSVVLGWTGETDWQGITAIGTTSKFPVCLTEFYHIINKHLRARDHRPSYDITILHSNSHLDLSRKVRLHKTERIGGLGCADHLPQTRRRERSPTLTIAALVLNDTRTS